MYLRRRTQLGRTHPPLPLCSRWETPGDARSPRPTRDERKVGTGKHIVLRPLPRITSAMQYVFPVPRTLFGPFIPWCSFFSWSPDLETPSIFFSFSLRPEREKHETGGHGSFFLLLPNTEKREEEGNRVPLLFTYRTSKEEVQWRNLFSFRLPVTKGDFLTLNGRLPARFLSRREDLSPTNEASGSSFLFLPSVRDDRRPSSPSFPGLLSFFFSAHRRPRSEWERLCLLSCSCCCRVRPLGPLEPPSRHRLA